MVSVEVVRQRLDRVGQGHLLSTLPRLNEQARLSLLEQIASLELESVPQLIRDFVVCKAEVFTTDESGTCTVLRGLGSIVGSRNVST